MDIDGEKAKKIIQALIRRSNVEHGWRDNPRNYTLNVTLFFGSKDPINLVKLDEGSGTGPLTLEILEALLD